MTWTIAALSSDVPDDAPLGVTVGERDIALFRDAQGVCRAVENRCAHRRAPLSAGKVTADGLIECPYHGWRYEGVGGMCKAIPNLSQSERVPGSYRIPAYYCGERAGFVWIASTGEETDEPGDKALDEFCADMESEGTELIAYPAAHYRHALLNAPSAVFDIPGYQIIDNHRLGEPVISDCHVKAAFAVDIRHQRDTDTPALATADFPYSLEVHCVGLLDRIVLRGPEGDIVAAMLLSAVPLANGLCRVIWRATASQGAAPGLIVRSTLNALALFNASKAAANVQPPGCQTQDVKGELV